MKHTNEYTDIKELFEYEMTEVLLKLKGEFAVISKDHELYKKMPEVTGVKIIPVTLADVECKSEAIILPQTIVNNTIVFPALSVDNAGVTLVAIPEYGFAVTGTEEISPAAVQLAGKAVTPVEIPQADIQGSAKITLAYIPAAIKDITSTEEISPAAVQLAGKAVIPAEIPQADIQGSAKITLAYIPAAIKDITGTEEIAPAAVQLAGKAVAPVEIPQADIQGTVNVNPGNITEIPQSTLARPVVEKIEAEYIPVRPHIGYKTEDIEIKQEKIPEVSVSVIKEYNFTIPAILHMAVHMPDVPVVKQAEISKVMPAEIKMDEILPLTPVLLSFEPIQQTTVENIYVEIPNFSSEEFEHADFQLSDIKKVQIPDTPGFPVFNIEK